MLYKIELPKDAALRVYHAGEDRPTLYFGGYTYELEDAKLEAVQREEKEYRDASSTLTWW